MSNGTITVNIITASRHTNNVLCSVINNSPQCSCTGTAASAAEAAVLLRARRPSVAVVDIALPDCNGIECIERLKAICSTQLLVYTRNDDAATALAALKAGADGYILYTEPHTALPGYIADLYRGGSPVCSMVARNIIRHLRCPAHSHATQYPITKREREILLLLDRGCTYNDVADQLFISTKTVRKHIYNIYGKLDAGSRTEAVNKYFGRC